MHKFEIVLKKVKVPKLILSSNNIDVGVFFEVNDKMRSFCKNYSVTDVNNLTNEIIADIKKREQPGTSGDDFLESLFIMNFVNQEEAEEKLVHFFGRVKDRIKAFKSRRTADDHLNKFHDLQNQECII